MRLLLRICLPMLITASPVLADDWFVSKFGKDDTLGAINHIDAAKTKSAAALVKQGKTVSLGMVTAPDTPAYGPRKFQMIVHQLNDGSGVTMGVGNTVGNDDTVIPQLALDRNWTGWAILVAIMYITITANPLMWWHPTASCPLAHTRCPEL